MKEQPISSLMARRTHTIGLDDTVQEVEALLAAHDLTWAPVVGEGGAVLGVISTADLLQFHAAKGQADRVAAWQLCTYKPISVTPEASVSSVAALMIEHRIHHVVVMERGTLCGVVSSLDFVRLCA